MTGQLVNRIRRTLDRAASPPATAEPLARQPGGHEPRPVGRAGSDRLAGRSVQRVPAGANVAADQTRPAAAATKSRRPAIPMPRLLPHTKQLCIHCRHNPAGFWASHASDQTVRRPWCLSCCQELDQACHHIRPFDFRHFR